MSRKLSKYCYKYKNTFGTGFIDKWIRGDYEISINNVRSEVIKFKTLYEASLSEIIKQGIKNNYEFDGRSYCSHWKGTCAHLFYDRSIREYQKFKSEFFRECEAKNIIDKDEFDNMFNVSDQDPLNVLKFHDLVPKNSTDENLSKYVPVIGLERTSSLTDDYLKSGQHPDIMCWCIIDSDSWWFIDLREEYPLPKKCRYDFLY